MSDLMERNLPHNADAERSVLGAILIDNDSLSVAQELLDEGDFYREAHRVIFSAMAGMGEGIDLVTLKDELARREVLENAGGAPYVASLVDGVPRSDEVLRYSRIVRQKSVLRKLITSASKILTRCYESEETPEEILKESKRDIGDID